MIGVRLWEECAGGYCVARNAGCFPRAFSIMLRLNSADTPVQRGARQILLRDTRLRWSYRQFSVKTLPFIASNRRC
jgi:hypothetical protein